MAKFCGMVGFVKTVDKGVGVYENEASERKYYGDITRDTRRWDKTEHLNDDINFTNVISIVSDEYANDNFYAIRYVKMKEVSWKVQTIEIQRPRIILTLGGVYNGPSVATSDNSGSNTEC